MPMVHRLMILGSMHEFVGLVNAAKARGIHTIVCDGYADGPAKAFADESLTIDVRDTAAIAAACKELGVDGIIASFSDLLAECLVNIADAAGLPCYATPERFACLREKPLMKQMFAELGVPTAKTTVVRRDTIAQDLEAVGFPCVIKPVNGYGSRGVYVLDTPEQVAERFDETASYSSFDHIIAEQFCPGREINAQFWLIDGKPHALALADREKTQGDRFCVPHVTRIVSPSKVAHEFCDDALELVARIGEYAGISTGPISMQFFWTPEDGIRVCEAAGRLLGYEHEIVTIGSGFSMEELLLDYVYDRDAMRARVEAHSPFFDRIGAGIYLHGGEGVVADVSSAEAACSYPSVVDGLVYYRPGEMIGHGVGQKPYVARYFIGTDTREELDVVSQRIYDEVRVYDADGNNLLLHHELPGPGGW